MRDGTRADESGCVSLCGAPGVNAKREKRPTKPEEGNNHELLDPRSSRLVAARGWPVYILELLPVPIGQESPPGRPDDVHWFHRLPGRPAPAESGRGGPGRAGHA